MDEEVLVAGREDKAAAKLQWIFAQAVLLVAGSLSAASGLHVVTAKQMQQGSVAKADSLIGHTLLVDKEREQDAGLIAEEPGVADVAQPNGGNMRAFLPEFFFECAQLRDMLATKNSSVVTQEDQDRRSALPQRAQAGCLAFRIGKRDSGQLAAIGFRHAGHSLAGRALCQAFSNPHIYLRSDSASGLLKFGF